eukprot:TRINITY_DN10080_c0_g1_i1.p1 TRINITY_DN10080_c0_g1~~TRINITY_DN10080_c0_g1_i1.p1  ORF type:complete len:647 (-),score=132.83 TRINITY_DN10080_c0_g1_i1:449-2389(-)
MSSALELGLSKYRERAFEVLKLERQRISDMQNEMEGQGSSNEALQQVAEVSGVRLETDEVVLGGRPPFDGEAACWDNCFMHGTGGQSLVAALVVTGSQQVGAEDRQKARIQATTGEEKANGSTNQRNRVGSSCCKVVRSEEALADAKAAPMMSLIFELFGNCMSLSVPRGFAAGTGSRCSQTSEIDTVPVILIGESRGEVVQPGMFEEIQKGILDHFEFVPQRLNIRIVLVENVDQKLLVLSILHILREQAGEDERKRLDIRVISLTETDLVSASEEEVMITTGTDAKAQLWDRATADISSVTLEELAAAEAFRQELLELRELGAVSEDSSADATRLQELQCGILLKQVEPMKTAENDGGRADLPTIPWMLHAAFTTLGDLCAAARVATERSSRFVSLLAYGQLEAAGAIDTSLCHPPMELVARKVELATSWIPDSEEELEKLKSHYPPSLASRFKPKEVRQREVTAEKSVQHVERFSAEELRLGATCLRLAVGKLEGRLSKSITPNCKSGLRYDAASHSFSDVSGAELDDIPVAVLGLAIDAAVDKHLSYCGLCSAYVPALSPVTHVFTADPAQARQALALAGIAAEGIMIGTVDDMKRLQVGLDRFRGQPYTVGASLAMVDKLLGVESSAGSALRQLLADSAAV